MAFRIAYARHEPGRVVLGFPYREELIAALKADIPAWAREYDPGNREWIVSRPYVEAAIDLLTRHFPTARITGEPDGDGRQGDDYWDQFWERARRERRREDERRRQQSTPPPSNGDPYATLHLLPTAPPQLVKAAYLTLVKLYHPDVARDLDRDEAHRRTVALTAAYRALQERGVAV